MRATPAVGSKSRGHGPLPRDWVWECAIRATPAVGFKSGGHGPVPQGFGRCGHAPLLRNPSRLFERFSPGLCPVSGL